MTGSDILVDVALVLAIPGLLLAFWLLSRFRRAKPPTEGLQEAPGASWAGSQAPLQKPGTQPSYNAQKKQWNDWMACIENEIQLATQEAMRRSVEEGRPTLLTIKNPYELPDGSKVTVIQDLPWDDKRRKVQGWLGDVQVDDQRPTPHEKFGYGFMPSVEREKWVLSCRERRAALKAGSLARTKSAVSIKPADSVEVEFVSSTDIQKLIDNNTARKARLNDRADAEFAEEFIKIRADAERMARDVFLKDSNRQALFVEQAKQRNVGKEVIEEEFIAQVVKDAEATAGALYHRTTHVVPSRAGVNDVFKQALSPDRSCF
jgi:hypothetical protein